MPPTDPSSLKSSSHPPTNTPYPDCDDFKTECVAYEIGDATHSVIAAVDTGYGQTFISNLDIMSYEHDYPDKQCAYDNGDGDGG